MPTIYVMTNAPNAMSYTKQNPKKFGSTLQLFILSEEMVEVKELSMPQTQQLALPDPSVMTSLILQM